MMSTLSDDKKIELLNDHYKDTFAYLKETMRLRDRLFVFILLTITLLFFQLYSPTEAGTLIEAFIKKNLELENAISITFIGTVIWFALLAFVMRYFQTVIFIERQNKYMHRLEEQLSPYYEDKAFTREGRSYLKNYPMFSSWAYQLYTWIFPILLIFVVLGKLINEYVFTRGISLLLVFNSVIALGILISTVLYLRMVHYGK
jgi:hypothetical protein